MPERRPLLDARGLYASVYGRAVYPAWQRLVHGRRVGGVLRALERSEWRAPEEIAREQGASLRALLVHAGARVPYYKELFAKLRFDPRGVTRREDLAALPVLSREIIRERYADLVDPASRGKNIAKGTSGTTGVPLQFEYSEESETWRQAVRLRGYSWAGYRLGMPTVYYWGAGDGPSGASRKVRLDRALRRETYIDCIHQDDRHMEAAYAHLARVRPHAIVAFTQAVALFARWIHERGYAPFDVPVLCGAEGVLPADREAISRAFGPRVFETYGARETMLMAAECEAHAGLHLAEESLVVEVARGGEALPPGETGDVLVTDLHNYAMPFIRYANGDVASMADGACPCGRGLRRLAQVGGRRADTLRDAEGRPIPGILFLSLIAGSADMAKQFRVLQKASGEVVLSIVRGPSWSDAAFAGIEQRLREHLRGLPFETVFVESIPPQPTGKHRPIVVEKRAS